MCPQNLPLKPAAVFFGAIWPFLLSELYRPGLQCTQLYSNVAASGCTHGTGARHSEFPPSGDTSEEAPWSQLGEWYGHIHMFSSEVKHRL